MRWGLLWWNVITVVSSSFAAAPLQDQLIEEPLEPVEPVDTIQQIEDFELPQTTQSARIPFYEPGTDFFSIPELYRHIKAGKNTSGLYVGPTFSKEFMIKTPSEKRISSGFKLLDWKRRRKRLDTADENMKTNLLEQAGSEVNDNTDRCEGIKGNILKSGQPATEGKISTMIIKFNTVTENHIQAHTTLTKGIRKDYVSSNSESELNSEVSLDVGTEKSDIVYTQLLREDHCNNVKSSCDCNPSKRSQRYLKFRNETSRKKRFKKRTNHIRKRSKRDQNLPFEDFVEFKRVPRGGAVTTLREDVSEKPTTARTLPSVPAFKSTSKPTRSSTQENYFLSTKSSDPISDLSTSKSPIINTQPPASQSHLSTSSPFENNTEAFITKELQTTQTSIDTNSNANEISLRVHETLHKKESPKFVEEHEDTRHLNETIEEVVPSKTKAKIVIGGEEIPIHPLTKEQKIALLAAEHANLLSSNRGPVFAACVTPPLSTTCDLVDDIETQRADCHPKGSGPLCPITLDPEAYGPRNEEEVEDALTGKLADRVVEVVMAKVGKCPRMMKELGLYAQGNLSSVESTLTHPENKESCKEKSSESLKITVLQDITNAVEKLANSKSSGLCLKPPEDLTEFLSWLLSEDADLEMPEPTAHLGLQPRREADYLFRSGSLSDEFPNEFKDTEQKYHWDNWMSFAEDLSEGSENESEGKAEQHARSTKNLKRSPRHLLHRNRSIKKSRERQRRRRRYTPWSLNDYP